MKIVKIKKIEVENFGGIAKAEYNFSGESCTLSGGYGSGKSTAYHAYLWALGFSYGNWEPLIDGYRIKGVETVVNIYLLSNGVEYKLSKTNKPKYKKDKFTNQESYAGTNFKYLIDDTEFSLNEYKSKIELMFDIDYKTLEILTDISLFNANNNSWGWKDRREFLFNLFNLDNEIKNLKDKQDFDILREYFDKGFDENEINKFIQTDKKQREKELTEIKAVIDVKLQDLANVKNIDFAALKKEKQELENELGSLLSGNADTKNIEIDNLSKAIMQKQDELNAILFKNNKLKNACDLQVQSLDYDISSINNTIEKLKETLIETDNDIADYKIDLENEQASEFNENQTICKACGRKFEESMIKDLISNFEKRKQDTIADINKELEKLANTRNSILDKISYQENQKNAKMGQKNALFDALKGDIVNTKPLEDEISALKEKMMVLKDLSATELNNSKIEEVKAIYANVIERLSKEKDLESLETQIIDLKTTARTLAQGESLMFEKQEKLQTFKNEKIKIVNECVNNNFKSVQFNMTKWLSSDASKEYEDCCNCVFNGTEYSALSSGQKLVADLNINLSLREYMNIDIPLFVDDVVLAGVDIVNEKLAKSQNIIIVTNEQKSICIDSGKENCTTNPIMIKDKYSLEDCDIRRI